MSKPYPQDLRDRAVRLVLETKDQYPSEHAAIKSIAAKLGIGTAQTLTNEFSSADRDKGIVLFGPAPSVLPAPTILGADTSKAHDYISVTHGLDLNTSRWAILGSNQ
ncbi:hypothetical protein [Actinospica robiniae]|uniref:hypothetical protein n=1 Tax=Actinospica robiniae TaxID=304901 RepID=UPI0012F847FF